MARSGADAFSHRSAAYALTSIGLSVAPARDATREHADALLAAVAGWSDGSCWPNFSATADPVAVARKYDPVTLAQLATLSTTYDPDGVMAVAGPVRAAAGITGVVARPPAEPRRDEPTSAVSSVEHHFTLTERTFR